jgi:hypothetical protein
MVGFMRGFRFRVSSVIRIVTSGVPTNTIRHADLNSARAACQQVAFKKAIASLLATLRHMSPHGIYQHRIFTQ